MKYASASVIAILLLAIGSMGTYIGLTSGHEAAVMSMPVAPMSAPVQQQLAPAPAAGPKAEVVEGAQTQTNPLLREMQPIGFGSMVYEVEFTRSIESVEDQIKALDTSVVIKKAYFERLPENNWWVTTTGFGGYEVSIDVWVKLGNDSKVYLGAIKYIAEDSSETAATELSGFLTSQEITQIEGKLELENDDATHLNKVLEPLLPPTP